MLEQQADPLAYLAPEDDADGIPDGPPSAGGPVAPTGVAGSERSSESIVEENRRLTEAAVKRKSDQATARAADPAAKKSAASGDFR